MIRAALVSVHKYTGLLAGALLAVTGISGSILVFDHRLDEMLTPAVMTAAPSGDPAPLQDVVDAARAAAGDQPTRIYIARRPGSAHVVRFPAPPGAPGPVEVSVAPADAKVLAVRTWGEYPVSWVYHLHYGFLSGATGKLVVGALGLCLLFFCVSGVVIWWPRRGRWRRALTIKRDAGAFRLNYDLHKTAGVYLLPVLAVVAFSGVELVFPGPVERLVARVLPVDDYPAPQSSVPPGGAVEALTVDRAVAAGQAVLPDDELKRVHLPAGERGPYQLFFNQPGEPWSAHAASAVWVDRYSGDVLDVWDTTTVAAGSALLDWQFPLHNGDALGLAGRWLVFVCGLTPALFFGTGVYMWWRKRRTARRSALGLSSCGTS